MANAPGKRDPRPPAARAQVLRSDDDAGAAVLVRRQTLELYALTPAHLFACAVVARRNFASAWIWAADLRACRTIHEDLLPIAAPANCRVARMGSPGAVAALVQPTARTIVNWREHGAIEVIVQWARFSATLTLDIGDAPAATAFIPAGAPPDAPATGQLLGLLPVRGQLRAAESVLPMDGALGALRYATDADDEPGAINLLGLGALPHLGAIGLALSTAGRGGDVRNVLWTGPAGRPIARPTVHTDPTRPLSPWRVTTADDAVELVFTPRVRRERSLMPPTFEQYAGRFDGAMRDDAGVRVEIADLPGVCTLLGP